MFSRCIRPVFFSTKAIINCKNVSHQSRVVIAPLSLRRQLSSPGQQASTSGQSVEQQDVVLKYLEGPRKGIVVMALNRPHAKNALNKNILEKFEEYVKVLNADKDVRVIILSSTVPGIFCAGADLKERLKMKESDVPIFVARARQVTQRLSDLAAPSVAALDGHALGGGLEIALACDLRVAASNVKVGLVETRLAIIPGAGGTQRLPRLVGLAKAKELIFTAKVLSGTDAAAIGLVDHVVDQTESKDSAYQKALEIAEQILPQGFVALRAAKQAINRGSEVDINSGLAYEELCYAQVIGTKDRIEGLRAFNEKRPPQYIGE